MYYHVYGHLYVLSKSSELGLSAYLMNCHYFELLTYLSELLSNLDIIFTKDHHVFCSEKKIYESNSKFNHRMNSPFVYDALFEDVEVETTYLHTLFIKGATAMKEKLCSYTADQLLAVNIGIQTKK